MAVDIERTDLRAIDFVTTLSRYAESDVIFWGPLRQLTFTTYKRSNTQEDSSDRFMIIPVSMEYRPDKLSLQVYGIVDLWWQIMETNRIFDIFDFKAGLNIRIPTNVFSGFGT